MATHSDAQALFLDAWHSELTDVLEDHPDTSKWTAAKKGKVKSRPQVEDGEWWKTNGPPMVQAWMDWRETSGWRTWTTPDGDPAIELGIEVETPAGRLVKMFIDRVFISKPANQLVIVDLKTGARTPESDLQLAVYRYGIYKRFGIDIRLGAYWMARTGVVTPPSDLSRYTPGLMEAWLRRFDKAIEQGIFLPHPTAKCRACSHRDFCAAYGGRFQHMDPDFGSETGEA